MVTFVDNVSPVPVNPTRLVLERTADGDMIVAAFKPNGSRVALVKFNMDGTMSFNRGPHNFLSSFGFEESGCRNNHIKERDWVV